MAQRLKQEKRFYAVQGRIQDFTYEERGAPQRNGVTDWWRKQI